MATVHTQYGPGTIIASETVRGQRQFKVAGEGFEVWLDEAKIGGLREDSGEDHPQGWFADEEPSGAPRLTADELVSGAQWGDEDPYGYHNDRPTPGRSDLYRDFSASQRQSWAPLDEDNSTELPYNPDPQHDAIGSFGDDDSSTIQPIHHIDADERLHSSDSISFEDEGDGEQPGPDPDLFAKSSSRHEAMHPALLAPLLKGLGPNAIDMQDYLSGQYFGQSAADAVNGAADKVSREFDLGPGWGPLEHGASLREANPAALAVPIMRALAPMALDTLMSGSGGGGESEGMESPVEDFNTGEGWGPLVHGAGLGYPDSNEESASRSRGVPSMYDTGEDMYDDDSLQMERALDQAAFEEERRKGRGASLNRYEGLSDRYIDLTASVDYHNDPVAQFRHDPDAYINRIGHVMDEGLNPRFAEYMDLVEADGGIREAAWKDVRAKAMRLKREGHVHVKDIAPGRIMASVNGDHGTYDVTILKGATYGGAQGNSISNWHCACEWGKWAFRRKFTFVGRLCSHAYASFLTMQSEALKGKSPKRRNPSDGYIVNRPSREQYLPTFTFAAGRRQADNLQFGPDRLTPELVVNDTDDAQIFLDVTKDERKETGPDDVMSDKDIVHFARLMRHCEVTEQPYPRQLVAFLARYAAEGDDVPTDFEADDAGDANGALSTLRSDADRDPESDLGNMADRVHRIQDAVEDAHDNGADASQFVAMVRKVADDGTGYSSPKLPGLDPAGYYENPGGGTYSFQPASPSAPASAPKGGTLPKPGKGQETPANAQRERRGLPPVSAPSGGSDPDAFKNLNGVPSAPGKSPAATPASPGAASPAATNVSAPSAAPGGAQAAPAAGGAAPAPMTSGNVSDGGVAGAENGNNSAIGKDQLDAEGYYTVQKGDTLSDIAQRSYGDMNKYQDLAKGNSIANPDVINEGQRIKIDNPIGNGGVSGDKTNPAGGGADNDIATPEPVNTDQAANPSTPVGTPPSSGAAETSAIPPATTATPAAAEPAPAASLVSENTNPALNSPPAPKPTAGDQATSSRMSAKDWLRWAADADSSSSDSSGGSSSGGAGQPSVSGDTYNPETETPGSVGAPFSPGASGGGLSGLVNDISSGTIPGIGGGGASSTPGGPGVGVRPGDQISGIGNSVGGAISGILPGLGGLISGGADAIGGLMNTFGGGGQQATPAPGGTREASSTIFGSQSDFDEWVRYAYPADMDNTADPKLLPHHPFNGSGYAGPLEIGTAEDNVKQYRDDHEDVTDLDYDVHADLGDLQKQGSYEDATDDGSDIVRAFQANMGGGFDGPSGGGRFDDFASAAQGFLRTAGRNYSLAEQDELIREGDKGGARNLASLDLRNTHYEDLSWT